MTAVPRGSETVKISLPWTWRPVKRRMLPGCEFFQEGDTAMQVARKLIPLEDGKDDADRTTDRIGKEPIPCSVLGCTQSFTSLLSQENHYKSAHCHSCVSCHRTLPSSFLLDLHIQETHDPLFALLSAKQPMYRCLVESCDAKFPTPDSRRQHMIKAHSYPSNFRFHRLKPASECKKRNKPTQSDTTAGGDMDVDSQTEKSQADGMHNGTPLVVTSSVTAASPGQLKGDVENSMAGAESTGKEEGMEVSETEKQAPRRVFVHKVPQNISFGHGISRGFQRPPGKKKGKKKGGHWHQQGASDNTGETTTNIEHVDMTDMAEALSEPP